jgi:putative hemolysin
MKVQANKEKKIKSTHHHFAGPAAARPAAATRAAPSSAFCRADEWSSVGVFLISTRAQTCSIGVCQKPSSTFLQEQKTRFYFKNFTPLFQINCTSCRKFPFNGIFSCSNGRNRRPSVVSDYMMGYKRRRVTGVK